MVENKRIETDILILYEGRARELESVCLIAVEMEKRGYKVVIRNTFSYQIYKTSKIQAKLVITPFLYNDCDIYDYVYRIAGKNTKIINLRWEQIYATVNERNPDYWGYPKGEAKKAFHVSWSDYLSELLEKAQVEPSNIINCGAIHLDFLTPAFHKYFMKKDEIGRIYNINPDYKWNLFISSFSYATLSMKEVKRLQKTVTDSAMEFANVSRESQMIILDWIEDRLKRKKNEIWIYRPHPAERNFERITHLERRYANFCVIRDFAVKQWIIVSDRIFNWISTSLADVYFANKNNYVLRPIEIMRSKDSGIMKGINFITSKEAFDAIFSDEQYMQMNANIKRYYKNIGIPIYKDFCNACEKVLNQGSSSAKINYNKILDSLTFQQRVKSSYIYYIYTYFISKMVNISEGNIGSRIFENKIKIYKNNLRNIASDEEIKQIKNRIRETLEEEL